MTNSTKMTVKQMTAEYNRMASEMDLPLVKKLKPTKQHKTVAERFHSMKELFNAVPPQHTVDEAVSADTADTCAKIDALNEALEDIDALVPAGIALDEVPQATIEAQAKHVAEIEARKQEADKANSSIKPIRPGTSIRLFAELMIQGGTVAELTKRMDRWTPNTIRSAIHWDLKQKGYEIEATDTPNGKSYRIVNSDRIL